MSFLHISSHSSHLTRFSRYVHHLSLLGFTLNHFQPIFYCSTDIPPLETQIPDPFLSHPQFLQIVAAELEKDLDHPRKLQSRLAIEVVRDMKSLHGAGVYTSLEIFAMAGRDCYLLTPCSHIHFYQVYHLS